MKKFFLIIFALAALVLFFNILKIVVFDINRLTGYGYGYLTGLVILFLLLTGSAIYLGIRIYKKREK
ncbi:MAG: hypothetical protein ACLFR2_07035 [Candidatus Kapaibacterium sp.]